MSSDLIKPTEYREILKDLYFRQPQILYSHLFNSFHQFIDEIIYDSLVNQPNYFYENVTENIIYRYGFNFTNPQIHPPSFENNNKLMFPKNARKHHLNYFSSLLVSVSQYREKIDLLTGEKSYKVIGQKKDNVEIANIPIMVKSNYCSTNLKKNIKNGECKYDPGGYFIVNGQEKVIISLEKMVDNKLLVFKKKDTSYKNGFYYVAQINSKKYNWNDTLQIVTIKNKKDETINITTSQLSDLPLFVILRALGLESEKEIISRITNDLDDIEMTNLLRKTIQASVNADGKPIRTQEEAKAYLITKLRKNRRISKVDENIQLIQKKMYLDKILRQDILPHLGENILKKAIFICYMTKKLLSVMLNRRAPDDRDNYNNKRIEPPGVLLGQLFRQNLRKMLNEIGKLFRKKNNSDEQPINMISQLKSTTIQQGMKSGLATGIWGISRTKKGVAQSLQRLTWVQSLSYLRRVMAPSLDASTSSVVSIRHLNNIQAFFLCPIETPEGQKIGLVKSLALMATITLQMDSQIDIIINIIKETKKILPINIINPLKMNDYVKLFINGDWIGCTEEGYELFKLLKKKRMDGFIDKFVTICLNYHDKILYIYSDGGRLIRPLLRVENNKLLITPESIKAVQDSDSLIYWNTFLINYNNIIEYEDFESCAYLMIAMYESELNKANTIKNNKIIYKNDLNQVNRYGDYKWTEYSHCEFHPSMMLGVLSSCIPFSNHNLSTKNIINFSQSRQAMGIYLTSYKDRMDISQILYHPQVPLVITKPMFYNHTYDLPSGENVIVAIMSYTGYNQEDSIIVNQSAIDRGLFRGDTLKKYHSEIAKNPSTSQDDIFAKPDKNKVTGMKQANYDKLNENGFVPENTEIDNQTIIIGKISPIQPTGNNNKVYKDNSEIYKHPNKGVIDRIHNNIYNSDGYEMYNVKVRTERVPVIGDKFSTRHGQKGTIGITYPQKDMPFTEEGIVPDIILNPHAMPSRMTIAQLIECIASKIAAIDGILFDGTPFNNYDVRQLPKLLEKVGYKNYGSETMYCGLTGRKMEAKIFIGPTYYMRLKHLVDDKVHARARGPRQALTRQPLEGRVRDGGLKIGEMEKDAMVAHGISQFLKERMMETSDITTIRICDNCGLLAQKMMDKDVWICPLQKCRNLGVSQVNVPYAFKLLIQELLSINIALRIKTKNSIYN